VCIDRSGSMSSAFAEVVLNVVEGAQAQRTRMEAVKAMFYAFRDRAESVSRGGHEIGLVQFDNAVETMLDLTPELDRFEAIVDDMQVRGTTAIYSAIVEAVKMLEKRFQEDTRIDLRVLLLTDGQNNAGCTAEAALRETARIGAVVDAIIVGNAADANLRKIVSATGGECYQIDDLGDGFELLEAESVVSLRARRGGVEKPPFVAPPAMSLEEVAEKDISQGAPRQAAPPPGEPTAVMNLDNLDAVVVDSGESCSGTMKRIMKELRGVASGSDSVWMHTGEGIHVFPAPSNLRFWRALIEGPAGTPFEGGVFALSVNIPDNYPFSPPKINFQTPVYHCNVADSGSVCLDILHDKWTPSLSIPKCLEALRILLQEPDTNNALRQWIAELTIAHRASNGADTRYAEKARELTLKEAALSVAGWKQRWAC